MSQCKEFKPTDIKAGQFFRCIKAFPKINYMTDEVIDDREWTVGHKVKVTFAGKTGSQFINFIDLDQNNKEVIGQYRRADFLKYFKIITT